MTLTREQKENFMKEAIKEAQGMRKKLVKFL